MQNQARCPIFGERELGEKTLDSAVVGFLLDFAIERIGPFCQIDGRHFHQGQEKGREEGHPGFVPRKKCLQDGVPLRNLIRYRPVLSEKG